jgi:hypothetical protein
VTGRHGVVLALVAVLIATVLPLTAAIQIYDSNHYALTEATALLAGDHPYTDFFEVGIPLDAYMAAGMQVLSGHRLIGEFLRQWLIIVAGMVVSFHLALRLTRSVPATLAVLPIALLIVAGTPVYHASKLFFFPAMLWVSWRYLEKPGSGRAAAVAVVTSAAFLVRHDFGLYLGFGSMVAYVLARLVVPASRSWSAMVRDAGAYAVTIATVVGPWAVAVQANEGLLSYTRARSGLYQQPPANLYASLLRINPVRALLPEPAPAPRPGIVAFRWEEGVDAAARQQLEREYGLRVVASGGEGGEWRYEVPNVYDTGFLRLNQYMSGSSGFDWPRLELLASGRPSRDRTSLWLQQMTILVPLALMALAVLLLRREGNAIAPTQLLFAGVFLVAIDCALIREPSYMAVIAPLTAALSARFVDVRPLTARVCVIALLLVTTWVAAVWSGLADRINEEGRRSMRDAFVRLFSAPRSGSPVLDYVRDCTAPGDRVLVTGQTPLHVSYYTRRPIAGGHINWHRGWLSDPEHASRSLDLLRAQSVPFAISTDDPVLGDLQRYPEIHAYVKAHYVELAGSEGLVLVDTRRRPTGRYGDDDRPCFGSRM